MTALPHPPEAARIAFETHWLATRGGRKARRELARSNTDPSGYAFSSTQRHWWTWQCALAAIAAQAPHDQTALELCSACGWKALIPGDCCLNCERERAAQAPAHAAVQPVQPTPLTEEQIGKFICDHGAGGWQLPNDMLIFARAIERVHGIGSPGAAKTDGDKS